MSPCRRQDERSNNPAGGQVGPGVFSGQKPLLSGLIEAGCAVSGVPLSDKTYGEENEEIE